MAGGEGATGGASEGPPAPAPVIPVEIRALIVAFELVRAAMQGDLAWVGSAANVTRFPR